MTVSALFEPLTLLHGPAIRNRFMTAPLTSQQSEPGGFLFVFDKDWMRQLAEGGCGLVQTGATIVEASGIACARQPGIFSDEHLSGLTEVATAIRENGGLSAVQLHHAGHRANPRFQGVPSPASRHTLRTTGCTSAEPSRSTTG
ncbi:oxidoreductase [Streptomyces sp. NPDC001356]